MEEKSKKVRKRRKLVTPVDISFLIFINFSLFTAIYEGGFQIYMYPNFVLMIIVLLLMISNNKKENKIMDLEEELGKEN